MCGIYQHNALKIIILSTHGDRMVYSGERESQRREYEVDESIVWTGDVGFKSD